MNLSDRVYKNFKFSMTAEQVNAIQAFLRQLPDVSKERDAWTLLDALSFTQLEDTATPEFDTIVAREHSCAWSYYAEYGEDPLKGEITVDTEMEDLERIAQREACIAGEYGFDITDSVWDYLTGYQTAIKSIAEKNSSEE